MKKSKTLTEALPELEEIAKELGIKISDYRVIEEYQSRHPEIFQSNE